MTRKQAIRKFVCEILPTLDCEMLRGKDLVCFCKPKECHVDYVFEKANA